MRIAAQIAMVVMVLAGVASLRIPLFVLAASVVVWPLCGWVIAWYVLFTLPRELVDRHAKLTAPDAARPASEHQSSGGLADYHIHRA